MTQINNNYICKKVLIEFQWEFPWFSWFFSKKEILLKTFSLFIVSITAVKWISMSCLPFDAGKKLAKHVNKDFKSLWGFTWGVIGILNYIIIKPQVLRCR